MCQVVVVFYVFFLAFFFFSTPALRQSYCLVVQCLFKKLFSSIIYLYFTCIIKASGYSAACCDKTSGVQVNGICPAFVPDKRPGLRLVLKAETVNIVSCFAAVSVIFLFEVKVKVDHISCRTARL